MNLAELAASLDLEFIGDGSQTIERPASLASAGPNDLCFINSPKYFRQLEQSDCGVIICPAKLSDQINGRNLLIAKGDPQYHFIQAMPLLLPDRFAAATPGIHATASIDANAEIAPSAEIGAQVTVGKGARIGERVRIGAGCVIEAGVTIGDETELRPGVILCHEVKVGQHCLFHPGVVIGSDGFGLAMHEQQWHKIPHLGSVDIGDDVEIGANTTIDRGALDDTVIGSGAKLDNLIQIAHNVRIGEHTAMAAHSAVAGSTTIGSYCQIGGAVGIVGHLSICDRVVVTAMTLVTKDISEPGVYSSGTPMMENREWRKNNARYKSLDKTIRSIKSAAEKTSK